VERIGEFVVLTTRDLEVEPVPGRWRYALPVPGTVVVEASGHRISGRRVSTNSLEWAEFSYSPEYAALDASCVLGELAVRSRKPGDTLQPLGLGGRKKVQDLLVDRKVDRADRDNVPIVVDREDRILWVAGHAMADGAKVTDRTQTVIILELSRSGSSPGEGA
jgi:tRNA(Ile)-lysidine synthase